MRNTLAEKQKCAAGVAVNAGSAAGRNAGGTAERNAGSKGTGGMAAGMGSAAGRNAGSAAGQGSRCGRNGGCRQCSDALGCFDKKAYYNPGKVRSRQRQKEKYERMLAESEGEAGGASDADVRPGACKRLSEADGTAERCGCGRKPTRTACWSGCLRRRQSWRSTRKHKEMKCSVSEYKDSREKLVTLLFHPL